MAKLGAEALLFSLSPAAYFCHLVGRQFPSYVRVLQDSESKGELLSRIRSNILQYDQTYFSFVLGILESLVHAKLP